MAYIVVTDDKGRERGSFPIKGDRDHPWGPSLEHHLKGILAALEEAIQSDLYDLS